MAEEHIPFFYVALRDPRRLLDNFFSLSLIFLSATDNSFLTERNAYAAQR